MITSTFVCSACTTGSISSLGEHKNAVDAMTAFLKKMMVPQVGAFGFKLAARFAKIDSFWIFTAGPETSQGAGYNGWTKYGTEFAQYILDNKLGDIATLPKRKNTKYHPTTNCQTWLWGPDQKACEEWYRRVVLKEKVDEVVENEDAGKSVLTVGRRQNVQGSDRCPRCRRVYNNHTGWECPGGRGMWPE